MDTIDFKAQIERQFNNGILISNYSVNWESIYHSVNERGILNYINNTSDIEEFKMLLDSSWNSQVKVYILMHLRNILPRACKENKIDYARDIINLGVRPSISTFVNVYLNKQYQLVDLILSDSKFDVEDAAKDILYSLCRDNTLSRIEELSKRFTFSNETKYTGLGMLLPKCDINAANKYVKLMFPECENSLAVVINHKSFNVSTMIIRFIEVLDIDMIKYLLIEEVH